MPALSAIFLVLAFVLSVTVGSQTKPWTWGVGLLPLGVAASAALPVFWRKGRFSADFGLLALGALAAGWFAWRALTSPVTELGQADLLLLAVVMGVFVSLRAIEGNELAEKILVWGIALLLLANVVVMGRQMIDPSFTPVFRSRSNSAITGFLTHYSESANYLIASTLLVGAAALFGRHSMVTRIVWLLIAAAGLAFIGTSPSRGGILGAAVGGGVFAMAALMVGKRRQARWFPYALVAIPVVGLVIGAFLMMGWQNAQDMRGIEPGMEMVLDNSSRLYFLGMALSCIGLHPLAGGGSRSFSWECFRFGDGKAQGDIITHKPELVHNELVQAATDYGLIGAGLLTALLGALVIVAMIRILLSDSDRTSNTGDAWRLGGLAALAGMFTQSCFSFVFHLLPGILLLGICLGMISRTPPKDVRGPRLIGSKALLSLAAVGCVLLLIPFGWKGSRVTAALWPVYFSKTPLTTEESRIDALTEALRIWPQPSLFKERAFSYQQSAVSSEGADFELATTKAIENYEQTEQLHPYDPNPVVNRANLLSLLKKDTEAEAAYNRAIRLQGGMEPCFHARFSFAKHLMTKALRQFDATDPSAALVTMESSAQQMEESLKQMHWETPDMGGPRVYIHENLGSAREANGDYKGAMAAYDFASTLVNGGRVHYRAGLLYGKMADSAWSSRRPGEALGFFMEAKKRILQARQSLPTHVTPEQRAEYLSYLDKSISYLQGAKVVPVPPAN
ncbi:O-antigen ligase family protein [Luteolibacter yonseiensis]|uniref:O-antigen ligase family protein n=1 Tax=Luteolibacter yonseiensis TaxID=1144680 RepID=A0A934VAI8_9BACT|nr:O-antigen ligase family protein [Luteolibacter yonseiensis]MBK1814419.1 O-antigen ligase family protein [Luteolibacter yonseiensis]